MESTNYGCLTPWNDSLGGNRSNLGDISDEILNLKNGIIDAVFYHF